MGKNLSEHKASVRWVNRHWKGLAGVDSPMEWSKEATFRGFRKHLHFTQKMNKDIRKRMRNTCSLASTRLREIRIKRAWDEWDEEANP